MAARALGEPQGMSPGGHAHAPRLRLPSGVVNQVSVVKGEGGLASGPGLWCNHAPRQGISGDIVQWMSNDMWGQAQAYNPRDLRG